MVDIFSRLFSLRDESAVNEVLLEQPKCKLLGPTALVVQGIMGVLVILSLVFKRFRESPQRPWKIWLFDVNKQVIGQMFVHGVNVAISDVLQRISEGNACVFYFLNILIDTTLGVGIIYVVLRFLSNTLTHRFGWAGFESGKYGTPLRYTFWIRQTLIYILSITTMKLVVVGIFALFPYIFSIGQWLLSWTGDGSNIQIVFVMGIFPIAMNILQFWLIDSIVKATGQAAVAIVDEAEDAADREPLFRASEDDGDDDDAEAARVRDIEASRPRAPSKTPSKTTSLKEDEPKSVAPSVGGSSTPGTGTTRGHRAGTSFAMHAYPPRDRELSLPTTSDEDESPTSARSNSSRRRSPPPPLLPRSPMQPAMNSPSLMRSAAKPDTPLDAVRAKQTRRIASDKQAKQPQQPQSGKANRSQSVEKSQGEDDWNVSWGEDGDDWAERVGEEDWTGRRVEAARGFVGSTWDGRSPSAVTPISVG